ASTKVQNPIWKATWMRISATFVPGRVPGLESESASGHGTRWKIWNNGWNRTGCGLRLQVAERTLIEMLNRKLYRVHANDTMLDKSRMRNSDGSTMNAVLNSVRPMFPTFHASR